MEVYTVVTGAGAGIGKELARQCAAKRMNLLLIGLEEAELLELKTEITGRGLSCEYFVQDLSVAEGPANVAEWISANNFRINVLINNAGVGSKGFFDEMPAGFYLRQIGLNVTNTCLLTRLLLPFLLRNRPGIVMNVGSMGGFFHMPDKTVYSATKAFVFSFSRSLRIELAGKGIDVCVLCPGGTDSNHRTTALHAELTGVAKASILTAEQVAVYALPRMLKGKAIIIPGRLNKLYYFLRRILPETWINAAIASNLRKVHAHRY